MKAAMVGLGVLLFAGVLSGKELFDIAAVDTFLNESNPYIYAAVGQRYVARARYEAARGEFDTRLGGQYDKKEYPVSDGELADIFIEKPTQSGVAFLAGFRRAEGVQEYNNIKTGDEGEVRVGVKVPVFALVEGMNARRFTLQNAAIAARQSDFSAQENLRHLRFEVYGAYYDLLYRKQAVELEAQLLERARLRESYVKHKVEVGELPEIERLEVRRQLLVRRQRLLEAQNAYTVSLAGLVRYLGISTTAFTSRFSVPPLPESELKVPEYAVALAQALTHRPDLKRLETERERYALRDDLIAIESYPRLNVAVYGVHDFVYDNGFKISVDMRFPLERRRYHGQKSEIQKSTQALQALQRQKRIEIETALGNRLATLKTLRENLVNAQEEIEVACALEAAERKKFQLGASDLVAVNLRELGTLDARMKKLSYALRSRRIGLEIEREMGVAITETKE